MDNKNNHITSDTTNIKVWAALLFLMAISISLAWLKPVSWTSGLLMLVSIIQAAIALIWFMHLKFESLFFRIMVTGILLLFVIVLIILFLDYNFR